MKNADADVVATQIFGVLINVNQISINVYRDQSADYLLVYQIRRLAFCQNQQICYNFKASPLIFQWLQLKNADADAVVTEMLCVPRNLKQFSILNAIF